MTSLVTALALTLGLEASAGAAAPLLPALAVARLLPPLPALAPETSARMLASKLLSDDPDVCIEEWEWSAPALLADEAPHCGTELLRLAPSVPVPALLLLLVFIRSWAAFSEESDECPKFRFSFR